DVLRRTAPGVASRGLHGRERPGPDARRAAPARNHSSTQTGTVAAARRASEGGSARGRQRHFRTERPAADLSAQERRARPSVGGGCASTSAASFRSCPGAGESDPTDRAVAAPADQAILTAARTGRVETAARGCRAGAATAARVDGTDDCAAGPGGRCLAQRHHAGAGGTVRSDGFSPGRRTRSVVETRENSLYVETDPLADQPAAV